MSYYKDAQIEIKTIIAEFEHARMLKEKQRKIFLFSLVCKVICNNKFSHQNITLHDEIGLNYCATI